MDVNFIMMKTGGTPKDFPIRDGTTVIGRGEECTLRVPLQDVSRRHCEVLKGDELKVRDLASSNGTYVNGQRVNEAVLKAGDRISVGPVVFTVRIDGEPAEVKPFPTRVRKPSAPPKPPAATAGEEEEEIVDAAVADAGAAEEEEIIDLEADVPTGEKEDSDPISALEALAAETDKPAPEEDQK